MENYYELIKKSEYKKKKRLPMDYKENKSPLYRVKVNPFTKFEYIRVFKLLDISITDVIKRTYLLDDIGDESVNHIIKEYIRILYDLIKMDYKPNTKPIKEFQDVSRLIRFTDFVKDKVNYDRSSYVYNPKYYPVKSKINLKSLNDLITNTGLEYSSLRKLANSYGVSYTTMRNVVHNDLKFRYRTVPMKNYKCLTTKNIEAFKIFIMRHYFMLKENYQFVYLDESNFNSKARTKRRWVNKRTQKCFYDFGRLKSINLILAISKFKVINYLITNKRNTANTIQKFIEEMIIALHNDKDTRKSYLDGKICLALDNAAIHKAKDLIAYIKTTKLRVIFFPPYNPSMNPAEYFFRSLKTRFYKLVFLKA